jgi:hypothetical protein
MGRVPRYTHCPRPWRKELFRSEEKQLVSVLLLQIDRPLPRKCSVLTEAIVIDRKFFWLLSKKGKWVRGGRFVGCGYEPCGRLFVTLKSNLPRAKWNALKLKRSRCNAKASHID